MASEVSSNAVVPAVAPPSTAKPQAAKGAWSPLAVPAFRALWVAYLVSLIGTWAREAGGPWLMRAMREQHGDQAVWVSLIQTAGTLPICLLSIAAGVLADIYDRRNLLILTNVWMLVMSALLAIITLAGGATPQVLLGFTFLLGIGAALAGPAFQYVIPELVPPGDLPLAVALNSVALNVGRAAGPVLGMLIVMAAGRYTGKVPAIGASFLVNAFAFIGVIWVLVRWRRAAQKQPAHREALGGATLAAFRFTYHSRAMRSILARVAAFILCAVIVWAQMPIVAKQQLGGGEWTYLLLMGATGVGAVIGVFFMPILDKRFSTEGMVAICTIAFGLGVMGLSLCHGPSHAWLAVCLLLVVGFNWVIVPTNFNIATQRSVPGWVKGRAIAMYMTVLFGSFAVGSPIWGSVTQRLGISNSLLIAGTLVCVGSLLVLVFPLTREIGWDFRPANLPPLEPVDAVSDTALSMHTTYPVDRARTAEFARLMRDGLRRQRLRNGATQWRLTRREAGETGNGVVVYEESVIFTNWNDRLRFHSRTTKTDAAQEEALREFLIDGQTPVVEYRARVITVDTRAEAHSTDGRRMAYPPPVMDWNRILLRSLEEFDAMWNRAVKAHFKEGQKRSDHRRK
jgi:MFS family permease